MLDKRTNDVRRDLSTSTNHIVDQSALAPDPVQTAIIAKRQPLVDAAGSTPVGTITADIVRGGTPPGTDRGVESPAGNLVADAPRLDGGNDLQALVNYLGTFSPVAPPPTDRVNEF